MVGLGLSKNLAIKYEADVKADRFLVIVHGSADDISRARAILANAPRPADAPAQA
ncbi:MAG: hypothetical protein WA159_24910 [Variovorax sp.]